MPEVGVTFDKWVPWYVGLKVEGELGLKGKTATAGCKTGYMYDAWVLINIIARTHVGAEIAHFRTRCIIRVWEAQGRRPRAFQILMMHLVGKCMISTWTWVLAFIP